MSATAISQTPEQPLSGSFGASSGKLLRVAWLAVLLGLAAEALALVAIAWAGELSGPRRFVAEMVQSVTWSIVVCVALAAGATLVKRVPAGLAVAGVLAAPLGFLLARGMHRGVGSALGLAAVPGPSALLLAALRGVEYGLLGLALTWLAGRRTEGVRAQLGAGLVIGVVGGGGILATTAAASPQLAGGEFAALALVEILFPAGCVLVLFAANGLPRQPA